MLRAGYYATKGGYHVRLDANIGARGGIGVFQGDGPYKGFIAYNANGEFAYKDEDYEREPDSVSNPGDSLDLVVERWEPL